MELEKTTHLNLLLEFYGLLLTPKQREYMELYYADDYSLGEIAEEFSVSRQAVYDTIKRTSVLLEQYEEKLCLVANFYEQQLALDKIENYIQHYYPSDKQLQQLVSDLQELHK